MDQNLCKKSVTHVPDSDFAIMLLSVNHIIHDILEMGRFVREIFCYFRVFVVCVVVKVKLKNKLTKHHKTTRSVHCTDTEVVIKCRCLCKIHNMACQKCPRLHQQRSVPVFRSRPFDSLA